MSVVGPKQCPLECRLLGGQADSLCSVRVLSVMTPKLTSLRCSIRAASTDGPRPPHPFSSGRWARNDACLRSDPRAAANPKMSIHGGLPPDLDEILKDG